MIDTRASINDFLTAAAAKQPTPGGGAVAALAGALAAAMGEMVLHYSVDKKDLVAYSADNREALAELTRARALLSGLLSEDQAVFQEFTDAKKRGDDVTALADACVSVPQAVGTTALVVLELANRVVNQSNKWLLSDLAVCGELAMATIRCAIHNVRVNLPSIEPPMKRQGLEQECDRLLQRGIADVRSLIEAIRIRQAQS